MSRRLSFLAPVLCLVALPSAQATIMSGYGAVADVGTYDSCAVICLRPGGLDAQVVNGGEFAPFATAGISDSSGSSSGTAAFTGDVFSPVLRARSESPAGSRTASDAIVTAIQGWTYTGQTSENFVVELALDGTIVQPPGAEGSIEGRAAVYLYPNATFDTNYSSFILETVAIEGTLLDREQMFLLPGLDLRTGELAFTANPGDELYVFMQLETKSERGATVDATGTFEMTFAEGPTSELEETVTADPSPTPVPAPPTLWLLGAAIAGLGAARRRRG